ncbi:MAG: ROK family transcriptional regulator [Acidobacteriaceae bacterium]
MQSPRFERGMPRVDLTNAELASSETARKINRDILLQLIHTRQPVSRAELARLSGLQRSTVSQISEQLMNEGWIREGATAKLPRGRRPTMLILNNDLMVFGVDLRPQRVTVAAVDLSGRLLSQSILPLSSDPGKTIVSVLQCVKRMQEASPTKSFGGIGISVPGRVDPTTQRLIFAPNLKWADVDLKSAMERESGLPVELENAANACLIVELWLGGLDGVNNAVLITVSEGLGSGILAGGQIVSGEHGMAGEFGHISLDPTGPRCGCGQNGCWETFASCDAALRYYHDAVRDAGHISFHQLLNLAEEGDANAKAALHKQATYIGKGMRMITAALSPELILIAGDVTSAWERFAPVIRKEVAAGILGGKPPRIEPSHEGEVARLRGAAALIFQRHPISGKKYGASSSKQRQGSRKKKAAVSR